jgi:hypothetical protein
MFVQGRKAANTIAELSAPVAQSGPRVHEEPSEREADTNAVTTTVSDRNGVRVTPRRAWCEAFLSASLPPWQRPPWRAALWLERHRCRLLWRFGREFPAPPARPPGQHCSAEPYPWERTGVGLRTPLRGVGARITHLVFTSNWSSRLPKTRHGQTSPFRARKCPRRNDGA